MRSISSCSNRFLFEQQELNFHDRKGYEKLIFVQQVSVSLRHLQKMIILVSTKLQFLLLLKQVLMIRVVLMKFDFFFVITVLRLHYATPQIVLCAIVFLNVNASQWFSVYCTFQPVPLWNTPGSGAYYP